MAEMEALSRPDAEKSTIIFDRGVTDGLAYCWQAGVDAPALLYGESGHRCYTHVFVLFPSLSPRTGPLQRLRANVRMSAYERSCFLRHLEEALAEGYGQLKVNGFAAAFRAYRFPLDGGYVTVSSLQAEGMMVGKIVLASSTFYVSVSQGSIPQPMQR